MTRGGRGATGNSILIECAKGFLMLHRGLTEIHAYEFLRSTQ